MTAIEQLKNEKKRGRQAFDSPFELHFTLCFQQNAYGGWVLAEGRRQKDAEEIAKIAEIAQIEN